MCGPNGGFSLCRPAVTVGTFCLRLLHRCSTINSPVDTCCFLRSEPVCQSLMCLKRIRSLAHSIFVEVIYYVVLLARAVCFMKSSLRRMLMALVNMMVVLLTVSNSFPLL